MSSESVRDWGEKRIVREIRRIALNLAGEDFIGDDSAIIPLPNGNDLVLSTDRVPDDLLARRLGLMTYRDLGRYIVEVNASDIVAMGGRPVGFLLNLGLEPEFKVKDLQELVIGAAQRGQEIKAPLVGGDTKPSATNSFVGVAVGRVPRGRAVSRGGVSPGDALYVTGPVGGFGAALAYFFRRNKRIHMSAHVEGELKQCLVQPVARLDMIETVVRVGTACIDITDGLGESIRELERASKCQFRIDGDAVPLHPAVRMVADLLQLVPLDLAFGIGLDLELLLCTAPDVKLPGAVRIGVAEAPSSSGSYVYAGGQTVGLLGGFEHFRSSARDYVAGQNE